jgi:methyl-accepting chemotaxis protein
MKVRSQIMSTAIISVILMAIVAAITFLSINSLLENTGWVTHTYDVILEADELTESMVNQETGMRGFLVTGDENYLEPYNAGVKNFDEILNSLKETVSDNPTQVGRLNEIDQIAQKWSDEAAEPFMAIKRSIVMGQTLRDQIINQVRSGAGKDKMDALRLALETVEGDPDTIDEILLGMLNLETGLRGYLLAKDEVFLEPYNNNLNIVRGRLAVLGDANITSLANDWINNYGDALIELQDQASSYQTTEDLNALMSTNVGKTNMDALRAKISEFQQEESVLLEMRTNENTKTSNTTRIILVGGVLLAILISIPLSIVIANKINKQLGGEPKEVADITEEIANGNLAISFDDKRKKTGIYLSVYNMTLKLSEVMSNINSASEQVASGSTQLSDSSMSLSQGATEQASSIEELTASVEEIASQSRGNAQNAEKAKEKATSAYTYAEKGNSQMSDMLTAMSEINDSSNNISKIIKVIDDIAFQTNILALNAAVEAARAGQHGKGFAVVAEEVRNLAARSAKAAKETTDMIEGSINKVEGGTRIANDTAKALGLIVDSVSEASDLIGAIALSSNEQALGVDQVNVGLTQISQVIQTTSATAEETAAASEELSGQSELLKTQVNTFRLREYSNNYGENLQKIQHVSSQNKSKNVKQISLSDSEFDKY